MHHAQLRKCVADSCTRPGQSQRAPGVCKSAGCSMVVCAHTRGSAVHRAGIATESSSDQHINARSVYP